MSRICQNCGKAVPNDAVLCPYCGTQIDYSKAAYVSDKNVGKKSSSTKIILIVVAVIAIVLVLLIAISATVYVYVSSMTGPRPDDSHEDAHVTVEADNNMIEITLVTKGDHYNNGYTNFYIHINGELVESLSEVGYWTVGEKIRIGETYSGYEVDGSSLASGIYDVTVKIYDTVVYDGDITVY